MTHPEKLHNEVLAALAAAPYSVQAIARAYGVHHSTVTRRARQAKLKLPSARARIAGGGRRGTQIQWGDWQARRKLARQMWRNGKGAGLREIAQACGYKSVAGAHYAVTVARLRRVRARVRQERLRGADPGARDSLSGRPRHR